jgi:hypothetical protein
MPSTGPVMIKGTQPFYRDMVAAFPPSKMATQLNLDGGFIPPARKSAPGSAADVVREVFRRTGRIHAKMTFG